MKPAHVAVLAGIAVLAVMLTFALTGRESAAPGGDRLLPGLEGSVNDVTALVIRPAGGDAFRVTRGESAWTVPAFGDYPADAGQVRRLVLRLAEARLIETKTSNPELYGRLGVQDPDTEGATGVGVTLEGVGDVEPVIIGDRETPGGRGTYARRAGEPTAWLVDQVIVVETSPLDWLDREVMDVPAESVVRVEIDHPDGDAVRIGRTDEARLVVENIPEGREVSGPTAADALARALTALRLDEVRPAQTIETTQEPVVARFTLDDGTLIEARTREVGDVAWTVFEVVPGDEAADGPGSPARLAARLEGWAYRLPAWKVDQLSRRLDDLLKPLPAD